MELPDGTNEHLDEDYLGIRGELAKYLDCNGKEGDKHDDDSGADICDQNGHENGQNGDSYDEDSDDYGEGELLGGSSDINTCSQIVEEEDECEEHCREINTNHQNVEQLNVDSDEASSREDKQDPPEELPTLYDQEQDDTSETTELHTPSEDIDSASAQADTPGVESRDVYGEDEEGSREQEAKEWQADLVENGSTDLRDETESEDEEEACDGTDEEMDDEPREEEMEEQGEEKKEEESKHDDIQARRDEEEEITKEERDEELRDEQEEDQKDEEQEDESDDDEDVEDAEQAEKGREEDEVKVVEDKAEKENDDEEEEAEENEVEAAEEQEGRDEVKLVEDEAAENDDDDDDDDEEEEEEEELTAANLQDEGGESGEEEEEEEEEERKQNEDAYDVGEEEVSQGKDENETNEDSEMRIADADYSESDIRKLMHGTPKDKGFHGFRRNLVHSDTRTSSISSMHVNGPSPLASDVTDSSSDESDTRREAYSPKSETDEVDEGDTLSPHETTPNGEERTHDERKAQVITIKYKGKLFNGRTATSENIPSLHVSQEYDNEDDENPLSNDENGSDVTTANNNHDVTTTNNSHDVTTADKQVGEVAQPNGEVTRPAGEVARSVGDVIADSSQPGRVKELGKLFDRGDPIFPKSMHSKNSSQSSDDNPMSVRKFRALFETEPVASNTRNHAPKERKEEVSGPPTGTVQNLRGMFENPQSRTS